MTGIVLKTPFSWQHYFLEWRDLVIEKKLTRHASKWTCICTINWSNTIFTFFRNNSTIPPDIVLLEKVIKDLMTIYHPKHYLIIQVSTFYFAITIALSMCIFVTPLILPSVTNTPWCTIWPSLVKFSQGNKCPSSSFLFYRWDLLMKMNEVLLLFWLFCFPGR